MSIHVSREQSITSDSQFIPYNEFVKLAKIKYPGADVEGVLKTSNDRGWKPVRYVFTNTPGMHLSPDLSLRLENIIAKSVPPVSNDEDSIENAPVLSPRVTVHQKGSVCSYASSVAAVVTAAAIALYFANQHYSS